MGPDTSDAWHWTPRKILHPVPRKSEHRDFRDSVNPDFWRFGSPEICKSGVSDFRNSDFRKIGNPKICFFRFPVFPDFRRIDKIQKSCKKATDVDFAYVGFPLKSMVTEKHRQSLWASPIR